MLSKISDLFQKCEALDDTHKPAFMGIVDHAEAEGLYWCFKHWDAVTAAVSNAKVELEACLGILGGQSLLARACSEEAQKLLEDESTSAAMVAPGRVLGNLTGLQALYRDLRVGETRKSLARKCLKGLERKKALSADPKLMMVLGKTIGSSGPAAERLPLTAA